MSSFETWWRKLGGLVTVCLLATLLAGPTFDAFLCKGDRGTATVAGSPSGAVLSVSDHQDESHSGGASATCPHGHCHHGVGFGAAAFAAGTELTTSGETHLALPPSRHASLAPSGLERPPRG